MSRDREDEKGPATRGTGVERSRRASWTRRDRVTGERLACSKTGRDSVARAHSKGRRAGLRSF